MRDGPEKEGCSSLLNTIRKGILERLCLSWALKDEEAFIGQVWAFLIEGTKEQK